MFSIKFIRVLDAWPEIDFIDDREDYLFTATVHRKAVRRSVKNDDLENNHRKSSGTSSGKTEDRILVLLKARSKTTIPELAKTLQVTTRAVENRLLNCDMQADSVTCMRTILSFSSYNKGASNDSQGSALLHPAHHVWQESLRRQGTIDEVGYFPPGPLQEVCVIKKKNTPAGIFFPRCNALKVSPVSIDKCHLGAFFGI